MVVPKQRGRRPLAALAVLSIAAGLLLFGSGALAVNATGAFELEGDATNGVAAGDDWDNVCYEVALADGLTPAQAQALCTASTDTNGATAVSWLAETDTSATIFTGGGSKDPQDPGDSWLWKNDGGLPDKDNLLHGFAARYSLTPDATNCPAGGFATCEVIFFGSDRYANDGDAVQGFWFFQEKIELTNTASGGGFKFSGHHQNGDLLVISDFSNGGNVSTIVVHKWDTTCTKAANNDPQPNECSAANLRLLASSTAANCSTSNSTAGFCGIVNPDTITMPWPFTDKKGTADNGALNGEFFEGGVNLSTLGLGGECFASVASETRSSTSPTATLKDFVLDNFGECNATLSTQVSNAGPVTPGTAVFDTLTVTSSQPTVTATGTVSWYLCGPIATGACDGTINTGNPIGTPPANETTLSGAGGVATTNSPNVNTGDGLAPGRYCFRAEWPGDTNFTAGPYAEFGGANGTNECFTVAKINTTTVTTPGTISGDPPVFSPATTIVLGGTIFDRAIVTGTAAGGDPTGTVDFFVCTPAQLTPANTGVCAAGSGTAVTGNPVGLVSDGEATFTSIAISGAYSPGAVGRYCFRANYSGSTIYNTSNDTGSAAECFTVTDTTGITSAQTWRPNDSATVTSTNGGLFGGTLTITLYETDNCSGTPVSGQSYTTGSFSGVATKTLVTTNSTYDVVGTKSVSWKAVFTSADPTIVASSEHCEKTSLTITN